MLKVISEQGACLGGGMLNLLVFLDGAGIDLNLSAETTSASRILSYLCVRAGGSTKRQTEMETLFLNLPNSLVL